MVYSPAVLDHFGNPRNAGALEEPDGTGAEGAPGRGNYMVVQIRVSGGLIAEARFQTYGCPGAIACGSMVTELAKGKTTEEARAITAQEVIDALGGLPPGKGHCGGLAVGALRKAMDSLTRQRRQPST